MWPSEGTELYNDFQNLIEKVGKEKGGHIELEVYFSGEYPNEPPFVRILAPRFQKKTAHITPGGSICIDLLTLSAWQPVNTIESVLVQIRSAIIDGEGRLDIENWDKPYELKKAISSFKHTAKGHGWDIQNLDGFPWEKEESK